MGKHFIAEPATAEEIRETLGITKADRAIVRKVMMELGYSFDEDGSTVRVRPVGKTVRKAARPEKGR